MSAIGIEIIVRCVGYKPHGGVIMSRLLMAIVLLGAMSLSVPAFAKDCLKHCQETCGGKGNFCMINCQQKCEENNRAGSSKRSHLPASFNYRSIAGL